MTDVKNTLAGIKPLTDDDCDVIYKIIKDNGKYSEFTDIASKFGDLIRAVLEKFCKKADSYEETTIKAIITVSKLIDDNELFVRCYQKIVAVRDFVIKKDATCFEKMEYTHLIKKDKKQQMIENFITTCRDCYQTLSQKEMDEYWGMMLTLLRYSLQLILMLKKNDTK
mgnify:CR=1 FL=1